MYYSDAWRWQFISVMISQWVKIQKKVKKEDAHFSSFNKLITSKLYNIISWADDSEENMVLRDT